MYKKCDLVSQWDTVQKTNFVMKLTVIQLVKMSDPLMKPKAHYYVQKTYH